MPTMWFPGFAMNMEGAAVSGCNTPHLSFDETQQSVSGRAAVGNSSCAVSGMVVELVTHSVPPNLEAEAAGTVHSTPTSKKKHDACVVRSPTLRETHNNCGEQQLQKQPTTCQSSRYTSYQRRSARWTGFEKQPTQV